MEVSFETSISRALSVAPAPPLNLESPRIFTLLLLYIDSQIVSW